jgi:DNA-directed RNA polymerase specialized sigma24 family protein
MGVIQAWRADDAGMAVRQIHDPWVVPFDQASVHERLLNYGRWACDKMQAGHCSSMEWQYDAGGREVQPARVARAAVLDAEVVFGALRQLPQRERVVLNLWYVNRRTPNRIAMRAGVSLRDLPAVLRSARQMLINRLRRVGG